jgi:hypothetical protein
MRISNWLHLMFGSNYDKLPNWLRCKLDPNWVINFKSRSSWVKSFSNNLLSLMLSCVGLCALLVKIVVGRKIIDVETLIFCCYANAPTS